MINKIPSNNFLLTKMRVKLLNFKIKVAFNGCLFMSLMPNYISSTHPNIDEHVYEVNKVI